MLLRFDPFREFDRLTQQLWGTAGRPAILPMPVDAYRQGDQFVVCFDLPGIDPDSIDVTLERDVLTVRAERTWQRSDDQEVLVAERPQGSFSRQLFLGDALDPDHIDARYEGGVLTVTLPVADQAKPRKVEITPGNGNAKAIQATSTEAS
jgi:HSP20 family protein